MLSNPAGVFISYSRQDYYFAESLTFHLCRRGMPAWMDVKDLTPGRDWEHMLFEAIDSCAAMVLVASPAALASPHVRAEWERALAAGKRIVLLGWHRRVTLPPPLQACEWLDFRGRFGHALGRLIELLGAAGRRGPAAGARPGRGPWVPPAVAGMVLALALPIVGYALAVAPGTSWQDLDDPALGLGRGGTAVLFVLFIALTVWGLCLSLLQRRMGMTRLMVCLGFVATPFALAMWNLARHGAAGLADMPPQVAQVVIAHVPLALAFAALPLAAMAVLWWLRPEDLLRWMPTGKGWSRYRVAAAEQARVPVPGPAQALAAVGSYRLLHDLADEPLADRLRDELRQAGATEARSGEPAATAVVLLSNHSSKAWLMRAVQPDAAGAMVTVVGSAIALAPELGWLWKRQWIDLRRWAVQRGGPEQGLPGLPEAATSVRLPAPVARLHGLLCAMASLVATGAVALAPKPGSADDSVSMFGSLVFVLAALMAWKARQLLRRDISAPRLLRWLPGLLAGGVVVTLATGAMPGAPVGALPAALVGAATGAVVAVWAWRTVPHALFWLPQAGYVKVADAERLAPAGDWRTLGTLLATMMLWVAVLQTLAPGLLE